MRRNTLQSMRDSTDIGHNSSRSSDRHELTLDDQNLYRREQLQTRHRRQENHIVEFA